MGPKTLPTALKVVETARDMIDKQKLTNTTPGKLEGGDRFMREARKPVSTRSEAN